MPNRFAHLPCQNSGCLQAPGKSLQIAFMKGSMLGHVLGHDPEVSMVYLDLA